MNTQVQEMESDQKPQGELVNEKPLVVQESRELSFIEKIIEKDMANLDVEKLDRLMDLQERHDAKVARVAFNVAMAGFQADCPSVFRSRESDKHSYAPLETIMEAIRPALQKHGLSVRFDSTINETMVTAICKVAHIGGYEEQSNFACPIEQLKSKAGNRLMNDSQAAASANSYAKRYAVKNAFNIVESYEDDDGESLSTFITEEQAASLRDELTALEADEAYFCTWLKIESLEVMPEKLLPKAQRAIADQKRDKK